MLRLEREVEFVFRLPWPPLPLGYTAMHGGGRNRTSTLTPRAPVKLSLRFSLRSLRTADLSRQAKRKRNTFSPASWATTSALLASSRANFTAACSFSTRSTSSLIRCAGSAPENFTVFQ